MKNIIKIINLYFQSKIIKACFFNLFYIKAMEVNNAKQTNMQYGSYKAKNLIIEESILNGKKPIELDPYVAYVSKSLCFIQTQSTKGSGSGFLIKLFKGTQDFFCLITCEHVIKREMVNQR